MTHAPARLRLLGPPALLHAGGTTRLERRPAAVCAYLALEGPTPKYRLAGLLWPDSGEKGARANMRQLLHRLRSAGHDLIVGDDVIALREGLACDAAALSALDPAQMLALGDAVELLQGLAYDDAPDFDDWLSAARESFADLHRRALAAQAGRLEADGDLAGALVLARELLQRDPLTEEAHRRVMRLHHLQGDRAAALVAFQRCRQRLAEDLGARPSAQTLALAHEIERGGELPRAAAGPGAAMPLSMLRPPQLVGRDAAWAAMEEAWRRGQVIFVSGGAGAGKTRLVEDFAAAKGPSLRIEGRPGDARVPYASLARNQRKVLARRPALTPATPGDLPRWVWHEAARLTPELGDAPPVGAPVDKLRFFDGVMAVYAHAIQGLASLVVDDLQFYDDASIEQSAYAMARAIPLGLGMPHHIAAFRDDEVGPAVLEVVEQLVAREMAVWIRLAPLAPEAVAALMRDVAPQAAAELGAALYRYAGGNPLFVLETIRHLHQSGQLAGGRPGRLPLSGKVKEIIDRRLATLSRPALALAQAAAVLQGDFGFERACAVLGVSPVEGAAALQELEASQVLHGERFSHDLLFETVLAGIPAAVRRWLHRSAAAVLAREQANPSGIAWHWFDAGDATQAAAWWRAAAGRSAALGLDDDARASLRLAERAEAAGGDPAPPPVRP